VARLRYDGPVPDEKLKAAPPQPGLELDLPAKPASDKKAPVSGDLGPRPSSAPGIRTSGPGRGPISVRTSGPGRATPPGRISSPGKPQGSGARVAQVIAIAAHWLIRLSSFGVLQARQQGGKALSDFSQRPEHTRWRAYAFGSYALLCAATFGVQLWEPNSLNAYVRVQPVALPESTIIFVRNDSRKPWKELKLTLNGIYSYESNGLSPGSHVQLPVNRFSVSDPSGKTTYAPKDAQLRTLSIDCDRGHFEQELGK
jgi:hypothetical protein